MGRENEKRGKGRDEQIENNKMVDLNPSISLVMLNVNCLKSPMKRQRLSD